MAMIGSGRSRRLRWAVPALGLVLLATFPAIRLGLQGREVVVWTLSPTELVQTVVATGRVSGLARVEIGSLLAGTVAAVSVREGDRVEQGAVLVRLKDEEARASVAQARSAVAQAEAGVAQALAGAAAAAARLTQLRSTTLPAAEQGVLIAAAEFESAQRTFERVDSLVSQGMLARAGLDEARRARDTAQGRLERERTIAEGSRAGGGDERAALAAVALADAAVVQARAAVAQARAALAAVEARLADLVLRAPAAGTVIVRSVEEGDTVQPGRTLLVLSRPGRTEIIAPVDEKNLALLALGQKAVVSADAYPERTFTAELATLVPAIVAASGTVTVKFAVSAPPAYLLPEMTVSVEIEVARKAGALALPLDAVRDLALAPWVLAIRDGRARRIPVGIGVRGANRVEILSGLAAGDQVIPATESRIAAGDKVRVKAALGG
ncbi:MAG: efflux RND transporter periplasmic adaptor subunit [Candidatus Methylomirabilia bacterium]